MLHVLDLFSGIGGFTLGLERTGGFKTVAFCEVEDFCRRVLNRHYPNVPVFPDVRMLQGGDFDLYGIAKPDVICGGFPCQDISLAGKGAGLTGERSRLWFEYARIIEEVRPQWVIIENVSALRSRGLDQVLGTLAAIGYDAEWHCIPASAVGAPHQRDRVWIIAYPNDSRRRSEVQPFGLGARSDSPDTRRDGEVQPLADSDSTGSFPSSYTGIHRSEAGTGSRDEESERRGSSSVDVAYSDGQRQQERREPNSESLESRVEAPRGNDISGCGTPLADASRELSHGAGTITEQDGRRELANCRSDVADAASGIVKPCRAWRDQFGLEGSILQTCGRSDDWQVEPDICRVADGVPYRVDRLRSLGNAIVPQIAEIIGHAILKAGAQV